MKLITGMAAALLAACASTKPQKVVIRQPPPTIRVAEAPPPAPAPQPRTTQVTVVQNRDAELRAQEAERLRQEEAARHAAELSAAEDKAREAQQQANDAEARANAEAAARADAERRAGDIERELAKVGEVRETERGLVVTLAGDVLFAFDRATLLPAAELKLGQLADTLKKADLKLAIEGHADAVGSDGYNQDLSQHRAMAVRDYLAARGVGTDKMQVAGFGESRPVADNATSEGRAMNRRVEIIVDTKTTASR